MSVPQMVQPQIQQQQQLYRLDQSPLFQYQLPGVQQFQLQGQPPDPVALSQRTAATKLWLRLFSFLADVVILGVSITLANDWTTYPVVLFAPPAGVAMFWAFLESISLCSSVPGHRRGFHPGVCMTVDSILWIGFTTSVVLLCIRGYVPVSQTVYGSHNREKGVDLFRATVGFGIVKIILHLILFIFACYEAHSQSKQVQVIVVQAMPIQHVEIG